MKPLSMTARINARAVFETAQGLACLADYGPIASAAAHFASAGMFAAVAKAAMLYVKAGVVTEEQLARWLPDPLAEIQWPDDEPPPPASSPTPRPGSDTPGSR